MKMDWIQYNKKWNAGYISILVNGYAIQESRYVWEYVYGKIPLGGIIHHLDGNKSNNYITNLKLTNVKEHRTLHKEMKQR